MPTLLIVHEVDNVEHWLKSTRREEFFGPHGITARTFIDPAKSNRVGLIVDVPDMAKFNQLMETPGAAESMKIDGVRPETMLVLTAS